AILTKTVDRAVLHRKSPPLVHRTLRFLGGIALAILVAIIVFGHGQGWTLFGGGADGTGESDQNGTPQAISVAVEKPSSTAIPSASASGEHIRITILGGTDVIAAKFYLIDDDTTPRTLAEVKELLMKKKEAAAIPPILEIQFTAKNTLS